MAVTVKDAGGSTVSLASRTVGSDQVIGEPVKGSATSKGGVTSSGTTQQLVASNSSREIIEVANGSASGIWVAFGSSAVAGQGSYIPAKATGWWRTTAAVNVIFEATGAAGPVGYTEW